MVWAKCVHILKPFFSLGGVFIMDSDSCSTVYQRRQAWEKQKQEEEEEEEGEEEEG